MLGLITYPRRSCHSSYQAIWIASSFFSLEFFGSSLKPSRLVTHLKRSVKRTVNGSVSGNLSARAMAMSSVVVHVNALLIFDFPHAFVLERPRNCSIHDQFRQMHGRIARTFDRLAYGLMIIAAHHVAQVLCGCRDFLFLRFG